MLYLNFAIGLSDTNGIERISKGCESAILPFNQLLLPAYIRCSLRIYNCELLVKWLFLRAPCFTYVIRILRCQPILNWTLGMKITLCNICFGCLVMDAKRPCKQAHVVSNKLEPKKMFLKRHSTYNLKLYS